MGVSDPCLLYTSDAADERSSVDLGGRRIIKKKKNEEIGDRAIHNKNTLEANKTDDSRKQHEAQTDVHEH